MDNLTMRPRWYSGPSVAVLCAIACCIVLGLLTRSPASLGVLAILVVAWVVTKFGTTIAVTPREVVLGMWLIRRQSAPRDQIQALHWYGDAFTFVSEGQQVLLKVGSLGWNRGQLLDLSEALGVRLYNHRTKRGLGKNAREGQLLRRAS